MDFSGRERNKLAWKLVIAKIKPRVCEKTVSSNTKSSVLNFAFKHQGSYEVLRFYQPHRIPNRPFFIILFYMSSVHMLHLVVFISHSTHSNGH